MCFPTNVLSLQLKHTQTRLVRSLHPARMAVSCDGSARYRKKGKKKSPHEIETQNPTEPVAPSNAPPYRRHRPAAMHVIGHIQSICLPCMWDYVKIDL
jgi:hypothetical protein